MVEREFHLGLPGTTDPRFLFRILSDPRFAGDVPSLTIERSILHPQRRTYYRIQIQAGSGFILGPWTMASGLSSMEEVERFLLDIACRSFESG